MHENTFSLQSSWCIVYIVDFAYGVKYTCLYSLQIYEQQVNEHSPAIIVMKHLMSFAVSASQQGKRKVDMEYFKLNSTKSKNRAKTQGSLVVSNPFPVLSMIIVTIR